MERKPIGLTVPYREVGYKEKSGWVDLTDEERNRFVYIDEKDKRRLRKYGAYIEQLLKEKNAQKK